MVENAWLKNCNGKAAGRYDSLETIIPPGKPTSLPGGGKIKTLLLYELQRLRHIAACGREQVEALRERRHVHRAAITYCTLIYRSAY